MGSQVKATCQCGYETSILIGGGLKNHTTTCYFPCLCDNCHNIVQVNLLAETTSCPQCQAPNPIPYDDTRLIGSLGNRKVDQWNVQARLGRELILTDGKYRCPKCGGMSLEFVGPTLLWD